MPYIIVTLLAIAVIGSISYIIAINNKLKYAAIPAFLIYVLVFIYLSPVMFLAMFLTSALFYLIGKKQREKKGE
jgi:asparagine N-glycosylation enzyme membrane subunit Stt3